MFTRLRALRDAVLESFWFLPLIMIAISQSLVIGVLAWGARADGWLEGRGFYGLAEIARSLAERIRPERAADVLSTVSGGMITLVSIVFSLAFVALTLTSQQLGPRVIDYWLRANATQALLGLSLSAYFAAQTGLMALGLNETQGREALLGAGLASSLGGLALVAAVVFATRMSDAIRADVTVGRLGDAWLAAVKTACAQKADAVERAAAAELQALAGSGGAPVGALRSGYLSAMDLDALDREAAAEGWRLLVTARENDFLQPGAPVALALGLRDGDAEAKAAAEAAVDGAATLTRRRRRTGLPDFEGDALTEVALRALSPSMNDPYTAMACIDRIGEGLCLLARTGAPKRARMAGEIARVAAPLCGADWLAPRLLAPIIHGAEGQPQALERLADRLGDLRRTARDAHEREAAEAARTLAARVRRAAGRLEDEADRALVERALDRAEG